VQQCAVEQLEHYDDDAEREDEAASLLPGVDTAMRANISHRRKSRGRLVRMFSGLSIVTSVPASQASSTKRPTRSQRASIWLDDILAPSGDSTEPHPGQRRQKRLSSAGTAGAPAHLLKKWTEQPILSKVHATAKIQRHSEVPPIPEHSWDKSDFSFAGAESLRKDTVADLAETSDIVGVTRVTTDLISPKIVRVHSISFDKVVGFDGSIELP
jgi:hypothetical protein